MNTNHNWLPFLAEQVRKAHADVLASTRTTIERAVQVGKLLVEAKAAVPHGGWLPWLEETGLTPRTAQRYMKLASLPEDKYDTVSHLGLKGALDAIAEGRALEETSQSLMTYNTAVRPLTEEEYARLKESIVQHGIITPVIVDAAGKIVDGFHRCQIAQELGLPTVPSKVVEGTEAELKAMAIALNIFGRHG
jgi:hypothetical protein